MSSKKIKELENRIVELEDYINSLKKKEWKEKYPNGQLVCSMYEFFYKYSYDEKEIPLNLTKYDINVCNAKILKVNIVDAINENLIEVIVEYEFYRAPRSLPCSDYESCRAYIVKYFVDKENKIAIKIKDEEKTTQRRNNYEFYVAKRMY